ncbi:MAG: Hsp33 family molecular chaperone HslO, partial [Myxococcales bacterium]|nr:Hsp33 family molecular chaperone HslO [Myxococcales bacterium]
MDLLQRAISSDRRFRVVAAVTTDLVREACRRHEIGGAEAIVLGRALTAGCLLSTLTKTDKERARLELRGSGPLGRVLIDSRSDGSVRGFIQRPEEASASPLPGSIGGRIRVGDLVGSGLLVVTRDIGLENPYQGVVELSTGEIDEDIELYLGRSEQLPSALGCDVVLDAHGGVLRAAGVPCARSSAVDSVEAARQFVREVGYPVILKPRAAAGASGTWRADDDASLAVALRDLGVDQGRSAASAELIEGPAGLYHTRTIGGGTTAA